ncbi:unnamed protein product [Angiostrongylus costaricensis]|uniref:DUF908 domain-containing protein n=1 Tax=Angiostrongylus costaricensis TaxID=334426 RepID=A0A158PJY4_ANGCS|nr:unnamed protein product [Angiostrongylus costaricensis]
MEAKRIRLDCGVSDSSNECSNRTEEASSHCISEMTLDELSSQDPLVIVQALTRLKSSLRSKAAVEQFMNERTSEHFSLVVELLVKSATDIGNKPLRSMDGCTERVDKCGRELLQLFGYSLFKNGGTENIIPPHCRCFYTHISSRTEPALCIASNPSLVDRLVLMLEADANTATQALRAIRGLIASTCFRVVLLSNAGFHLGMMLTSRRNSGDVVEALTALARKRVRDTGRQVAERRRPYLLKEKSMGVCYSDCAERLLELFFDDEVYGAKELVLMLCKGSADIRDRMGEARAIQRIVESANDSISNCKLLTAFAQEAWGRADLRESGALDFLISRLSSIDFRSKDRLAIVQPLHHFVHDINGIV